MIAAPPRWRVRTAALAYCCSARAALYFNRISRRRFCRAPPRVFAPLCTRCTRTRALLPRLRLRASGVIARTHAHFTLATNIINLRQRDRIMLTTLAAGGATAAYRGGEKANMGAQQRRP